MLIKIQGFCQEFQDIGKVKDGRSIIATYGALWDWQ